MHSRKLVTFLPLLLVLASCSRDPKILVDQGNKFFNKGKYKEAVIMYRRAVQKNLRYGEAYYRWGLTDLKLGAYGEAVHMLRRAVDLEPNNVDAITKLADIFLLASAQDRNPTAAAQTEKEAKDLVAT